MFCGLENAKKKQTVSDFLWLYPPLHQSCKECCPLAPLRNDLHCCIAPGSECHWLGSEPCPSKPWWQAMGSCLDSVNRFERDWIKFYCSIGQPECLQLQCICFVRSPKSWFNLLVEGPNRILAWGSNFRMKLHFAFSNASKQHNACVDTKRLLQQPWKVLVLTFHFQLSKQTLGWDLHA